MEAATKPECEKEKLVREYFGQSVFDENTKCDAGDIVQCLYDFERYLKGEARSYRNLTANK